MNKRKLEKEESFLIGAASTGLLLIVIALAVYGYCRIGSTKPANEDFATFGAFLSGIAGPIVTAISVMYIRYQIIASQSASQKQFRHMKKQILFAHDFNKQTLLNNKLDNLKQLEQAYFREAQEFLDIEIGYIGELNLPVKVRQFLAHGGYPETDMETLNNCKRILSRLEPAFMTVNIKAIRVLTRIIKMDDDVIYTECQLLTYKGRWDAFYAEIGQFKIESENYERLRTSANKLFDDLESEIEKLKQN